MLSRTHVLISEPYNGGIGLADSTPLEQPPNWVDWASMYEQLTWTMSVSGVTGAPTAWQVRAKFQYRQMHSGATYRFQTPRWYDLSEEQIASHVVEGVGWYGPGQPDAGAGLGIIATQATDVASPLVVSRSLRVVPAGVRVLLDLSFTGGTAPKVKLGLEVTGKGPA